MKSFRKVRNIVTFTVVTFVVPLFVVSCSRNSDNTTDRDDKINYAQTQPQVAPPTTNNQRSVTYQTTQPQWTYRQGTTSQWSDQYVNQQWTTQQPTFDYTVYITETGGKYHRWGCRYLRRSAVPISRSRAISLGYGPCSVCNP